MILGVLLGILTAALYRAHNSAPAQMLYTAPHLEQSAFISEDSLVIEAYVRPQQPFLAAEPR